MLCGGMTYLKAQYNLFGMRMGCQIEWWLEIDSAFRLMNLECAATMTSAISFFGYNSLTEISMKYIQAVQIQAQSVPTPTKKSTRYFVCPIEPQHEKQVSDHMPTCLLCRLVAPLAMIYLHNSRHSLVYSARFISEAFILHGKSAPSTLLKNSIRRKKLPNSQNTD